VEYVTADPHALDKAIEEAGSSTLQAQYDLSRLHRERALRRIQQYFPAAHLVKVIVDYDEFDEARATVHQVFDGEAHCLFDATLDDHGGLTLAEDDLSAMARLGGDLDHWMNESPVAIRLDEDRVPNPERS
jgi:hypothetical protein